MAIRYLAIGNRTVQREMSSERKRAVVVVYCVELVEKPVWFPEGIDETRRKSEKNSPVYVSCECIFFVVRNLWWLWSVCGHSWCRLHRFESRVDCLWRRHSQWCGWISVMYVPPAAYGARAMEIRPRPTILPLSRHLVLSPTLKSPKRETIICHELGQFLPFSRTYSRARTHLLISEVFSDLGLNPRHKRSEYRTGFADSVFLLLKASQRRRGGFSPFW